MKSNIFLSQISVVDHGYINYKGQVIGGSFNPGFIITGTIDESEKVVVDFSTIKKDIKGLIDIHISDIYENGFDHKIWFIEGYSQGSYAEIDNTYCIIETDACTLKLPLDAVKIIRIIEGLAPEYTIKYIEKAFECYLTKGLSIKYPMIGVEVECINTIETHRINQQQVYFLFTYSHGLKDSTSYGCQNIAHGHLSFIQSSNANAQPDHISKMQIVASELGGAVFVNKSNIVFQDNSIIALEYTTERGVFNAQYKKSENKLIILDTETTIEYLAEYVKTKYNVGGFYISEGLSKGCIVSG
jgi:hypothetical protein